jgi:predicted outer membrane lipoprotein
MEKNMKKVLYYLSWIVGLIAVLALTYGIVKSLIG